MKPVQIGYNDFDISSNPYEDIYLKRNDRVKYLRKVFVPYKMVKIHFCGSIRKDLNYILEENKGDKKESMKNAKKIVKIGLSINQKRMYTMNQKSEIYQWFR